MNHIGYSEKQIAKYQRQKYIAEIEKISKNLFRMLRDEKVSPSIFCEKFKLLKDKLEKLADKNTAHLDSEYHRLMEEYIEHLYQETVLVDILSDEIFDEMREAETSNLNRLQKLKNSTSYKKEKHKSRNKNEDWG
jgi:hypothetical protein